MTHKVWIEKHIEQVVEGERYRGYMRFGCQKFDYELVFAVHIDDLVDVGMPQTNDEVRELYQLTVKKGDEEIELDDAEYGFFLEDIVGFALMFFYSQRIKQPNMPGIRVKTGSSGGKVPKTFTNTNCEFFDSELRAVLSGPKFGCRFSAE